MAGALIVTAELGREDFSWLDGLRRRHFPPERNQVPAHLTLFHALPPSAEAEASRRLADLARESRPRAWIEGLMDMGGGVAFRVVSPDLDEMRDQIAESFHGCLSAQDSAGWRPHVTIQNKVPGKVAGALYETLKADFQPRPLSISGLGLHRYMDGPWRTLATWPFRGR